MKCPLDILSVYIPSWNRKMEKRPRINNHGSKKLIGKLEHSSTITVIFPWK